MKYLSLAVLVVGLNDFSVNALRAHYSMLFPQGVSARPGQPITILFHPKGFAVENENKVAAFFRSETKLKSADAFSVRTGKGHFFLRLS